MAYDARSRAPKKAPDTLRAWNPHSMAVLAASVANELNDELTLLLNELTYSLDLVGGDHPASGELEAAQRAALRCSGIATRLLQYTRRVQPPARPLPLERLLERA